MQPNEHVSVNSFQPIQPLSTMIIAYLLLLTFILLAAFYAGRYLFWALFMKDAPSLEEFENRFGYSNRA